MGRTHATRNEGTTREQRSWPRKNGIKVRTEMTRLRAKQAAAARRDYRRTFCNQHGGILSAFTRGMRAHD